MGSGKPKNTLTNCTDWMTKSHHRRCRHHYNALLKSKYVISFMESLLLTIWFFPISNISKSCRTRRSWVCIKSDTWYKNWGGNNNRAETTSWLFCQCLCMREKEKERFLLYDDILPLYISDDNINLFKV